MRRAFPILRRSLLAATLVFTAISPARAQEPPRTKEVKDAEKFITTAQMTADTAEKRNRLEKALGHLEIAIGKDPANARVWLSAGQVYTGLGKLAQADSAFDKAEQLFPTFKEETLVFRSNAWAEAFEKGSALMAEGKNAEAIRYFELAETIQDDRPESKLNLGAIYATEGDADRAEKLFRSAIVAVDGPITAKLSAEDQAQWRRYAAIAQVNVADMIGRKGVMAFQAEKFDDAVNHFREASKMNPASRDFYYNMAQSMFAQALHLDSMRERLVGAEKALRAKKDVAGAKLKADSIKDVSAKLVTLYTDMEPAVLTARKMDPNNLDMFLLLLRSYRLRGDLSTDAALKTEYLKRTDELFKQHQSLAASVNGVSFASGGSDVTVRGTLNNIKLAAATPVTIHVTLTSLTGAVIGEQDVVVTAPAVGASVDFETKVKVAGDVAGWSYTIK